MAPRPDPRTISLAEASRQSGRMLKRGRSDELEAQAQPTLEELAECILFAPGDGRIWLNDQRTLLFKTSTLGRLRHEMIDVLGMDTTRAVFNRVGYEQGARDAELVLARWPDKDLTHHFAAGPRLHTLEGFVKAETVRFEYDLEAGHYYGEFIWRESSEADEHLKDFGISHQPACWLQIAYPTGYTSRLFGKLVLFREVECRAMGHAQCRCIGKPLDAWGSDVDAPELEALGRIPRSAAVPGSGSLESSSDALTMVGVSSRFSTARRMLERVARTVSPAPAKNCSRAPCMKSVRANTNRLWPSTAPPFPTVWWKRSCLAWTRVRSPAHHNPEQDDLNALKAAPCFWMKSPR